MDRNKIIEFKYNGRINYALVYGITKDGRLACYRVVCKEKQSNKYIPVLNDDGSRTKFQVQYGCRFIMPEGCHAKSIMQCKNEFLKELNERYSKLPSLAALKEEYELLHKQINKVEPKERKSLVARCNGLAKQISDRSPVFLQETKKSKIKNKYSNYRVVPDKNGIRKVSSGGRVSPK